MQSQPGGRVGTLGGPEIERANAGLLWAASRPAVEPPSVRAALEAGADPDAVGWCALANRVGPLYVRALTEADGMHRLDGARATLERDARLRQVQEELLLPQALRLAVSPLMELGLEPVVFKGPAVAARYPAPGLRPMDDIDVIVPARQHQVALRALTGAGWQVIQQRPGREHYDTYLLHPAVPDLSLELHWELSVWRERANGVRAMTLWNNRRQVDLAGVPAFVLSPEIELLALATHAGKPFHHFGRLIWSVDIAVVIAAAKDELDWDRVAALARRFRCQTVLAVALDHARRLGVDAPEDVVQLPGDGLRRTALDPLLDESWPLTAPDIGTVHRLRYALSDSPARQAELLLGEITDKPLRKMPGKALQLAALALRRSWRDRRPARQRTARR